MTNIPVGYLSESFAKSSARPAPAAEIAQKVAVAPLTGPKGPTTH
jgi:hypothetical protein